MSDFVKGKSVDNPKFLKSAQPDAAKAANNIECARMRGLAKPKEGAQGSFLDKLKSMFQPKQTGNQNSDNA